MFITQRALELQLRLTNFKKNGCIGSRLARYRALSMPKITPLITVLTASVGTAGFVHAAAVTNPQFKFTDANGKAQSVPIITKYYSKKLQVPAAPTERGMDPKLMRAATIAQERANAHSRSLCWRYVKEALLASGAVNSYPATPYAKQAGQELESRYGFKKLTVHDPFKAPVGSVLVYGAKKAAGHVEIRTKDGFVSDFRSKTPSPRPLLGVYTKS
jgi:hypothetical protein